VMRGNCLKTTPYGIIEKTNNSISPAQARSTLRNQALS
jgi:hypothetical protein